MKHAQKEIKRISTPGSDYDLVVSECPKGVWVVVYQGQPIQIRREHRYKDQKTYTPQCWTQRGGAARQARVLNQLFQTTDFEIAQILGKTMI